MKQAQDATTKYWVRLPREQVNATVKLHLAVVANGDELPAPLLQVQVTERVLLHG